MTQHPSALPPKSLFLNAAGCRPTTSCSRAKIRAVRWWTRATARTAHRPWRWCTRHCRSAARRILNTHLHSDHCGGNAALQAAWPGVQTAIPRAGRACAHWDYALSYTPTGQGARSSAATRCCSPAARCRSATNPGRCTLRRGTTALHRAVRAAGPHPDLGRCAVGKRLWRGLP